MRTLPLALRYYLGATCIVLLTLVVAVIVSRTPPLVLVLGLVPLGALPVVGMTLRQTELALRNTREDAAVVRRRSEQLEEILGAGRRLHLPQTPAELLQLVVEAARALTGASTVAAYLPDPEDATLLQRVALAPVDATEVGPTYLSRPATPLPAVNVTSQSPWRRTTPMTSASCA